MSIDYAAFHSSECDDPTFLVDGWYLGPMDADGVIADGWQDDFRGPYASEAAALAALVSGAYITGPTP